MPPFSSQNPTFTTMKKSVSSNVITINVGGQLFQTTKQTLSLSGTNSILSSISTTPNSSDVPFIDRDPEIFSILLSLLRTGNLPSKAKLFDLQDLIFEAQFYGLGEVLVSSLSNPSQFEAFNLEKSVVLPLSGRDSPSAISTTSSGSVHVAHGSKITSFDWSLKKKSTILTHFTAIDSILALSPSLAAAGATDFSGLQILDLKKGFVKATLNWENQTKSSSTVQAIGSSSKYLFTSFESGRRNSNTIMLFDLQNDFLPVGEIAHGEIYGAELNQAIPATKLQWVPSYNLLMAAGSHTGPSGILGNIRLWDIRSGQVHWEINETVDCFSDVTVSDNLSTIFKVGINSGEVYSADMRMLDAVNPWFCHGDGRKGVLKGKKEGAGCKIESNGNQVFCSKGGDVELWSEILMGNTKSNEDELDERVFRKNLIGRMKDGGNSRVTNIGFGGNRMVVTRKDQQSVEVWQSASKGY
ncbi:hypothetical protein ACHQM5_000571 [Ranunculus cassubicifolius]